MLRYLLNVLRLLFRGELPLRRVDQLAEESSGRGSGRNAGPPSSELHLTWRSPSVTKSVYSNWKRVLGANPALKLRFQDDQGIETYMRREWSEHPVYEIFDRAEVFPVKSDIWRYCVLHDRGGVYADIKSGMSGDWSAKLLEERYCFLAMERHPIDFALLTDEQRTTAERVGLQGWLLNYLLVSPAGHVLMSRLLDQIAEEGAAWGE